MKKAVSFLLAAMFLTACSSGGGSIFPESSSDDASSAVPESSESESVPESSDSESAPEPESSISDEGPYGDYYTEGTGNFANCGYITADGGVTYAIRIEPYEEDPAGMASIIRIGSGLEQGEELYSCETRFNEWNYTLSDLTVCGGRLYFNQMEPLEDYPSSSRIVLHYIDLASGEVGTVDLDVLDDVYPYSPTESDAVVWERRVHRDGDILYYIGRSGYGSGKYGVQADLSTGTASPLVLDQLSDDDTVLGVMRGVFYYVSHVSPYLMRFDPASGSSEQVCYLTETNRDSLLSCETSIALSGHYVFYQSRGESTALHAIDLTDGTDREIEIGETPWRLHNYAVTPDLIYYFSGDELHTVKPDGTDDRLLTTVTEPVYYNGESWIQLGANNTVWYRSQDDGVSLITAGEGMTGAADTAVSE